jgi:Regulator of chromosome condensation (RCC1) repeat
MTGAIAVAAGGEHVVVLKTDGTVWTFGSNQYGQLGRPPSTVAESATPKLVMSRAKAIAAGYFETDVVATDGSLWRFGLTDWMLDSSGQRSTAIWSAIPSQVMVGVTAVAAGGSHVLALKPDGSVWSFGSNLSGQLGVSGGYGTSANNPIPAQVMSGGAAVKAGYDFSGVVKNDGSLWTFGDSFFGQLGSGIETSRWTPTQVMTGVSVAAAGGSHTIVRKTDGSMWSFGNNEFGQLGRFGYRGSDRFNGSIASPGQQLDPSFSYAPLQPARLLDSRPAAATVDHLQEGDGVVRGGTGREVQVAGRGGIPTAGAASAVLNITVTGAEGAGFLTTWPCGHPRPNASTLNFTSGATVANAAVVGLGAGGKVCVFADQSVHVIVDSSGYYLPDGESPVSPVRVVDSRVGGETFDGVQSRIGRRAAGSVTEFPINDRLQSVPWWVTYGVVLNVTVVNPTQAGFLTVWPCDQPRPGTSNLNFARGETRASSAIVGLGPDVKLCVFTDAETDLLVDLSGHIPDSPVLGLVTPMRIVDSRPLGRVGVDGGIRSAGSTAEVTVAHLGFDPQTNLFAVPDDVYTVVLSVTATGPEEAGFVTVWPCGRDRPNASNLNFGAGQTVANMVVAEVGRDGKVCVYASASTHLLVDIAGSYRRG